MITVPGWSREIANRFIRLAATEGRCFDQMQLQDLVYIAHGWCLALTGEPLTGDRPEATPWEQVLANGTGTDIPHHLIRTQFLEFADDPLNEDGKQTR